MPDMSVPRPRRSVLVAASAAGLHSLTAPAWGKPWLGTGMAAPRAKDSRSKDKRMVYFLGQDDGEVYDYGGIDALDGDVEKVVPQNEGPGDGIPIVRTSHYNQGVPLDPTYMPTRFRVNGPKRPLVDVLAGYGSLFVNQAIKGAVEGLEPGVHQFFPITPEWKDGTPAGERWGKKFGPPMRGACAASSHAMMISTLMKCASP